MAKTPRTRRFYVKAVLTTLVPVLAAALATWLFAVAPQNKSGFGWLIVLGGVLALGVSGVVPGLVRASDTKDTDDLEFRIEELRRELSSADTSREEAVSAAKREQLVKLRDQLMPIASNAADMARQPHEARHIYLEGVAKLAAAAVANITADHVDRPRAVVYLLDAEEKRMRAIGFSGRGNRPRPFNAGTPRGESALDFIDRKTTAFYEDLNTRRPDGYDGTMADYRTFISTPIWTNTGVYGMVTLDAPEAHSFDKGDVALVELAAELMSVPFEVGQDQDSDDTENDKVPSQ